MNTFNPFSDPANRPKDLGVQNFAGLGGGVVSQVVVSAYDLYEPNELIGVFERHSYAPSFRLKLDSMGFSKGCSAPTLGHYEYPWREDLVKVGSIVQASAGPGTPVIVALHADSMYDAGATVGGVARQASFPREGENILFANYTKARIVKKDTTVTPHRLTLSPVKSTVDLAGAIVADESYAIVDNAYAEGSGLPPGVMNRVIQYHNTFQISKEASYVTGSSATNKMYYDPIPNVSGAFYLKVEADTYYRFENKMAGALLFGQQDDNNTVYVQALGFDAPISGTEGFLDFGLTNSVQDFYTPGSYTITDFDQIGVYYEAERLGTRSLCNWLGNRLWLEIENLLLSLYNDDMSYFLTRETLGMNTLEDDMQKKDANDWSISIGFKSIKKGGYKFNFSLMHEFNYAMGVGSSVYDFQDWNMIAPCAYTNDKRTGEQRATLGYEYKELGGYSRQFVVGEYAGVGAAGQGGMFREASGPDDIKSMGMVHEGAFHGACPNQCMIQRP